MESVKAAAVHRTGSDDRRVKDFLRLEISGRASENSMIRDVQSIVDEGTRKADEVGLPQLEIVFPSGWSGFTRNLEKREFQSGLIFVERVQSVKAAAPRDPGISILREEDSDGLVSLIEEQQAYHYSLDPDFFASPADFQTHKYIEEIKALVRARDAIGFWIQGPDGLVGFAAAAVRHSRMWRGTQETYVMEIAVSDRYRSKGFGSALMNAIIGSSEVMPIVWTTLSAKNSGALKFYLSAGFESNQVSFYLNLT